MKRKFLSDVAMQCENLGKTEKGGKPSILKDKSYEALKTFSWCKILEEGQKRYIHTYIHTYINFIFSRI